MIQSEGAARCRTIKSWPAPTLCRIGGRPAHAKATARSTQRNAHMSVQITCSSMVCYNVEYSLLLAFGMLPALMHI